MISSKRFDLIVVIITALTVIGMIAFIILPYDNVTGNFTGIRNYSDLHSVTFSEEDYFTAYSDGAAVKISLMGDGAECISGNVKISDGNVTILGTGTYVLEGELSGGSVTVDCESKGLVRLILNGVDIKSEDFSALYIKNAEKTVISLMPETANSLYDGEIYNAEKSENGKIDAALYAGDDLVINGSGTLSVTGNYCDGIKAKDTLKITEGKIKVAAKDDGINVNDFLTTLEAEISIETDEGDAIKCKHNKEEKGFVAMEGTVLWLNSGGDGISASSSVYLTDVNANITSGGGSEEAERKGGFEFFGRHNNSDAEEEKSTKAVKAGIDMVINGGKYILDAKDDALHADNDVTVTGGEFEISTGDDAVHADMNVVTAPDKMNISKCYEGIEGAYVTINDGEIKIVSDDDGINATGENAEDSGMMFGGSENEKTAAEDIWLTVNGGHICIETSGDGFDSNGSAVLNGGFLEIYGPEDNGNGSIDVGDGGYVLLVNGGKMLAVGSSGMAEKPSEASNIKSVVFYLDKTYERGKSISLKDEKGTEIISGYSEKSFSWVCISTDELNEGEKYSLYANDECISEINVNGKVSVSGERNKGMGIGRGAFGGNGGKRPEMPDMNVWKNKRGEEW